MPPTPRVSQLHKVSSRSRSSSPLCGLATLLDRTTPSLRSTLITRVSSLLWTAPPLALASVFFLMVFATSSLCIQSEEGRPPGRSVQHCDGVLTFRTKAHTELMPPKHRLPRLPPGQ